jgi:Zn-dependent protease with chaperone function
MLPFLFLTLTPQQAAIRALADQDLRVATVGFRLARAAGSDFCPGQYLSTAGLVLQDAAQYSVATRDDARVVLALGDGPTVVGIVGGATAQGVRAGDVIAAVNGVAIATRPGAYARVAQVEDALEGVHGTPVMLDVRRGGTAQRIPLVRIAGCRSRFQIVRGGLGATQADGRYVQISEAMMALAPGDDALAAVLAHELSHNILRHTELKTPSKQSEYEADALSVRLVARAGYSLDAVLPFWEALRKRSDYGIFADGSHPGWRKRLAALAEAVAAAKEPASQPPKAR